jgi:hypothetical protein
MTYMLISGGDGMLEADELRGFRGERVCQHCDKPIKDYRRVDYCSDACRKAATRTGKDAQQILKAVKDDLLRRGFTVYPNAQPGPGSHDFLLTHPLRTTANTVRVIKEHNPAPGRIREPEFYECDLVAWLSDGKVRYGL